jgi:hypothetical protein
MINELDHRIRLLWVSTVVYSEGTKKQNREQDIRSGHSVRTETYFIFVLKQRTNTNLMVSQKQNNEIKGKIQFELTIQSIYNF